MSNIKRVKVFRGIYECIDNEVSSVLYGHRFILIDQFDGYNLYKDCDTEKNYKILKRYEHCFRYVGNGCVWIKVNTDSMWYKTVIVHEVLEEEEI